MSVVGGKCVSSCGSWFRFEEVAAFILEFPLLGNVSRLGRAGETNAMAVT